MTAARAPRGRRPGAPDTKAAILAAARNGFAASGFARTSVRAIAAEAGVDPALVHHYFGTKDELFLAARDFTGHIVLEINTRRCSTRAEREADLRESLEFAREHFSVPAR